MSENLNITFQIQGTAQEEGHVTLRAFLDQMELLLKTMRRFDALVDDVGQPRVYYRIINASHQSPLTMELEPVGIKVRGKPVPRSRIKKAHDKYFGELFKIQSGQAASPDVDDRTLEVLQKLAKPKSPFIASQVIHNSGKDVVLDHVFEQNLAKMLGSSATSIGSIKGGLEALNFHDDARKFWIYPPVGPSRVECQFLPGEQNKVKQLLGKFVFVHGIKKFRPNSALPHKIEVREFHEIKQADHSATLERVRSLPKATQQPSSDNDLAHEW